MVCERYLSGCKLSRGQMRTLDNPCFLGRTQVLHDAVLLCGSLRFEGGSVCRYGAGCPLDRDGIVS